MFCSDPYISLLKQQGYNVVRLPREDFVPLTLLASEEGRDLSRMGLLAELLQADSLPQVKRDTPAAGIAGKRTADMNVSLGLNLLGSIIGAMGGGQIGLDTAFNHARSLAFEFPQVLADDVSIVELDKYLGRAQIDPDSRHLANLLELDDLYVVTGILKSKRFTVAVTSAGSADIELDVPAIKEVVGAKVGVSSESGAESKVSFEGQVPLVFGFQARRLIYEGGNYIKLEPVKPGSVGAKDIDALRAAGRPVESNMFLSSGAFVRVR